MKGMQNHKQHKHGEANTNEKKFLMLFKHGDKHQGQHKEIVFLL